MATLRQLLKIVLEISAKNGRCVDDGMAIMIEQQIRQRLPRERVYIPPMDSRKDPARVQRLKDAAKMLPSSVVAMRYGVSRSWVNRAVKK